MLLLDFHRQTRALSWLIVGALGGSAGVQAQIVKAPPLVLKPSSLLEERLSPQTRKQLPTYLQSNTLNERTHQQTVLDGQVIVRRGELLLKADQVDYDQVDDFAKARGNVYINLSGNVYEGPALDLHLDAFEGFFTQPSYRFLKNKAYGRADRIDFVDPAHTVMHNASFTTCQRKPGPDWVPDWFFKGDKISIDNDRNVGLVQGATVRFKGVPILPFPDVEFPLNDERKSGLLPPNIGIDNIGGLEYTQPYYWNLAPNRDVTFYPTYWSKRGINLGTEFRYIENAAPRPPFQGVMRFDYMEKDLLRNDSRRWGANFAHTGLIDPYLAGGGLGLNLSVNRVSDDDYWKDFSITNGIGVQRLLSSDAGLTWTNGTLTTGMRAQKWQTLQDLANPLNRITPPFDRLPQITASLQKFNIANGFDFRLDGDFTRFSSVRTDDCANVAIHSLSTYSNCAPNADRAVSIVQLSRPFVSPYGYLTPKLQLLGRSYQFDGGLPSTSFYGAHQGKTSASVSVPTFSLDAGMAFERNNRLFSRDWIQTLEPRIFYVHTPYRNQNYLPNYDSGSNAFNFASIFTENAFGGYDRISDSKLLTVGATSRFIDPETGAEGARFGIAQRLRMQEQQVTLPDDPTAKAGISDVLAGASLNLSRAWALDSTVQYNPKTNNFMRRVVGGRYSPSSYRVINAAWRTGNDESANPVSQQLDVGWQWPLHDLWGGADGDDGQGRGLGEGRWYSVARVNYDMLNKKAIESVVGFEYDAGCWLSRTVIERLQIADGLARQRILFQLEFVGLSRIGTNALGSMRNNVPRYQPLRQPTMNPSRFGNYD
ncbi:LPS assembly protein LptD [Limnohabitans sp.]|uniref:LPS-assembly protein LptD n=1 Tax=Limnohabitans sp. TaxID=1907725 RepID=UPI00286F2108|nr:LPS assembly protein LptD [Limnohabitans sp.]